jgi:hypothetical protein
MRTRREEKPRYTVEAHAETKGEGNGWYEVPDEDATIFVVFDEDADEPVDETFATRGEAERFVHERSREDEEFEVCPACRGHGTTVNPNIDAHGLTAQDFADDPDFAESYWRGDYDQTCAACHGERVVTQRRIRQLAQNAEDRRLAAREDGNWDAYCGAGDWRFG